MSVKEVAAVRLDEKKSKFYAHLYQIDSLSDIEEVRALHNRLYKKAAHHCYAAVYGTMTNTHTDGEVGSPGRVLLEVLELHNLCSHMLMVSRIFGGIKLGPAGVSRAFREAGNGAVVEYETYKQKNF
ncbi:MAG TPA: YigZ family protein [Methanocorpusculum sp.]|nr:YigZ family protein [Methanocorpusculum sp.]